MSQTAPVQSTPTSTAPMQAEPVQAAPVQDAPASAPATGKDNVKISLICGIVSAAAALVFLFITPPHYGWNKKLIPSLIVAVLGIAAAIVGLIKARVAVRSEGKKATAGMILSVIGLISCVLSLASCGT